MWLLCGTGFPWEFLTCASAEAGFVFSMEFLAADFYRGFAYLPVVLANLKSGFVSLFWLLEISVLSACTSVFSWQAVCILSGQWGKGKVYFARSEKGHLQ